MLPRTSIGFGLAAALLMAAPGLAPSADAATHSHATHETGPKKIGQYGDWIAATHQEAGQTVCYAFTRASSSTPSMSGRGEVVLTVAERPSGRDAVAISAGFAYPANASVTVQVDQSSFDFYTAQRSAFARDGHAAAMAFERGARAIAKSPAPRHGDVTDTFSLRGFTAAYQAINKACPAK